MRERILRLALVLTVIAWVLAVTFRATRGSNAMLGVAITLTLIAVLVALIPARYFETAGAARPALSERDLALLRQAIQEKKDVSFVYRARDGSTTSRRVTPVELFEVGDTPVLGAFCHLRNGERTFVLDRVGPVTLEGPARTRDAGSQEAR
jgi:predicted DNA-binding transcriptional regulator YafY